MFTSLSDAHGYRVYFAINLEKTCNAEGKRDVSDDTFAASTKNFGVFAAGEEDHRVF